MTRPADGIWICWKGALPDGMTRQDVKEYLVKLTADFAAGQSTDGLAQSLSDWWGLKVYVQREKGRITLSVGGPYSGSGIWRRSFQSVGP